MSKKKRVFIIGSTLFLLVGAFLYLQPIKVGAVSVFTSGQLAPSAVNGYILSTNGTANSWIANTSSLFPFTPQSWGNSTSTTLGFLNGFVSTASSTFSNLGTGAVYTQNGLLLSHASTSLSVAYQDVWRDGNANVFANNFIPGLTTTSASGGTVVLTPASTRYQMLTGSNNHTYQMPNGNASGMNTGATWEFNNDTANGFVLHVQTHGGVFIADVPNGGYVKVILTDNGTSEGSWETHALLGHNNVSSTNALGLGTTTPYAQLSIHANANAPTIYQTLFSIGSSTASATTTLFSISNTGAITTSLGTGCVTATAGLLSAGSACGTVTSVTATAPLFSSGGATPNLTWFGLSTTSALTQGQLLYNTTGGNGVASVATSSVTINTPLSGSIVGVGTGLSLSLGTVGTANGGTASTTALGGILVGNGTSAIKSLVVGSGLSFDGTTLSTTGGSGTVTSITLGGGLDGASPITTTGTITAQVGTSTVPTLGQLAYWTGVGTPSTLGSVATGTVSAGSSAITVTAGRSVIGGALAIDCAVASGSQAGCLSTTDWTTFNNKTSWPWTINAASVFYGQISNSTTTEMHYGATGFSLTASSTSAFSAIQAGSSSPISNANAPLVVSGNTNTVVQSVIRNSNPLSNASGCLVLENASSTDTTYYGELCMNGPAYSQASFSAQNLGDMSLNANDWGLTIGTASSTNPNADLRFLTGGTASSSIRLTIRKSGFIGIGTTSPLNGALTIATNTPQLILTDLTANPGWAIRSISGSLYFSTSTLTAPSATSTLASLQIDKNGKFKVLDVIHNWFGVVSPTRALSMQVGTTTTWTATTSGAYIAQAVAPFPGTIRQIRCSLDASFLGVNIKIGGSNIAPSYFVASTTVGVITPTATNTFTEGQVITASFGTTTTASTQRGSCTLYVTETP